MALKAYIVLKAYGKSLFGEIVDLLFERAGELADLIEQRPGFELLIRPDSNIVCFRCCPEGVSDLNAFNKRIREKLISEGRYYLVQTQFSGQVYLRCTIMNPFTDRKHLSDMLDKIQQLCP